jgi:hypothetical protein
MKDVGDLISESWKEYKENFPLFLKIFLLLGLLPSILSLVFQFFVGKNVDFGQFVSNGSFEGLGILIFGSLFISIAIFVFSLLMAVSYFYFAFYKEKHPKMTVSEAIKGGLTYFWKFLGLSFVLGILLLLLYLLFIIPGIIFSVFWIFSFYVLMREGTSISESMKRSKLIVKGRWWTAFGYSFVFGLVIVLISLVFSIPELIYQSSSPLTEGLQNYSFNSSLFEFISSLAGFITIPFSVLFGKNLYLDFRKTAKKKS